MDISAERLNELISFTQGVRLLYVEDNDLARENTLEVTPYREYHVGHNHGFGNIGDLECTTITLIGTGDSSGTS